MIVVAKGLYGLGGNIAVLADALRLGEALGCGVLADWAQGRYGVTGANVADLLFDFDRRVPWPGQLDGLRVFPQAWSADVARTKPTHAPSRPLAMCTTVDAEDYGLDRLAADYDVVVVSRDSRYWHSSASTLAPYVQALRPNQEVRDGVAALGLSRSDIGVHFRHGNGERTVVPPDIGWFFDQVDDLSEQRPGSRVFLCTDCSAVHDAFVTRYGSRRVLASSKAYRPPGTGEMHSARTDDSRYRSAVEAAVDIWALGRCGALVGSPGFFTGVARRLRTSWQVGSFRAWVPVHRSYGKPADVRPLTEADGIGRALVGAGVPLDGIHVSQVPADDGRWEMFYLYWLTGRLDSLDEVEDPSSIATTVREHRLY